MINRRFLPSSGRQDNDVDVRDDQGRSLHSISAWLESTALQTTQGIVLAQTVRIEHSFRTSAIVTGTERPSRQASLSQAINQVVSKRMVKKQQVRWTDRGAHLLLQVRTRVLNEEWRSTLSHWYPAMYETCDAKAA
jgi:hypothetical protein